MFNILFILNKIKVTQCTFNDKLLTHEHLEHLNCSQNSPHSVNNGKKEII